MRVSSTITAIAGTLLLGVCATAERASAQVSVGTTDPALLQLGAGGYDIFHNYTAGVFRGEFRFGEQFWVVTPLVGAEVTTKGSVYGYGGFGVDVHFGQSWVLTPDAVVGLWSRGDGKELGSTIEFRTGADFDYQFEDASRLGFSFHHISNAGIGKHNPGEEELLAVYAIPLDRF